MGKLIRKKKSTKPIQAEAEAAVTETDTTSNGDLNAPAPVPEIPPELQRDREEDLATKPEGYLTGMAMTTVLEEPATPMDMDEKNSQFFDDPNFPLGSDDGQLSEKNLKSEKAYSSSFNNQHSQGSYPPSKRSRLKSINVVPQDMYEDDMSETREVARKKWRSHRLRPGEVYEKPWVNVKDRRHKYERWLFYAGVLVGCCVGGYLMYTSWTSVTNSTYCLIFHENFTSPLDEDSWNYEIEIGGFGKGTFEWTTSDESNIYVDGTGLHINPTLTVNTTTLTSAELLNGAILNLTAAGTCTSNVLADCAIYSNSSSGTIIPPVRSARITTSGKKTIKYGKVEVQAKLPIGDWLWPSIWMLPQDNVYGDWPESGEIDIASSRGNAPGYEGSGRDVIQSTLHWGPNGADDAYWRTNGAYTIPRTDFSKEFHTFGLEWSPNYMFMFLDSRLLQVFFIKFSEKETFWERGDFGANTNQSALVDPWSYTGRPSTPFDQYFYLVLDVAVGGTDGWFPDYEGDKPWVDDNSNAPLAFWEAVSAWYPTWGDGDTVGMTIRDVKMWSLGACDATTTNATTR